MKRTTLKDIAEAAEISVAAVSQVLSGKGNISPAKTTEVRLLAEQMGYAKRQKTYQSPAQKSRYVALLQREELSYLWNFTVPLTQLLEDQVTQMGKSPIIFHAPRAYQLKQLLKQILGARVGVLFALNYVDRELFIALELAGVPVIVINHNEYQKDFCSVLSDNHQAAYEATQHLLGLGHTRIGYADYFRDDHPFLMNERSYGFQRALEERQLAPAGNSAIRTQASEFDVLEREVARVHRSDRAPTAWVAHDDFFAACLIEALKAAGLGVPEDVSVIAAGGDVLDYSLPFVPKITTMQADKKLMVSMAWSLYESRLGAPASGVQVLKTKMTLVDRGTCRPCPPRP